MKTESHSAGPLSRGSQEDRANIVSQEAHRGKWNKDTRLSPRRIRGWMGAELLLCLGKIFPCCCWVAKLNLRPRAQCKRKKFHVKIKRRIKSRVLNVSRWCKIRWDLFDFSTNEKAQSCFYFFKSGPFHFVCLLKWQKYAKRCDKNDKGLTLMRWPYIHICLFTSVIALTTDSIPYSNSNQESD